MSDKDEKKSPDQKLIDLLDFDPTKGGARTPDLLSKVMGNYRKKKEEENEEKATELIIKAVGILEKRAEAEAAYKKSMGKSGGELTKLIEQIEAFGGKKKQQ
jgi:hypothetical protein